MMLHIGGASAGSVLVVLVVLFFLIFAVSFAFGGVPEGERRFSRAWSMAWLKASLPRMVAAGAFCALLFAGSALSGNSGGANGSAAATCDEQVAPLTGNAPTEARVIMAIDGMERMAEAAASNDADGARTIFFVEDAHNLTHDIDAVLRAQDQELAKQLCLSVIVLENQMAAASMDTEVVAREAAQVAAILGDARTVIDFSSATPSLLGAGPCSGGVAAVTDQPLTKQRVEDAVASMEDVAALAGSGQAEAAQQLFFLDAHTITHDIDGPLRRADEQLAIDLCEAVVAIETQISGEFDPAEMESEAENAARLLEEAGTVLGILQ